jgi:hypothetical protein
VLKVATNVAERPKDRKRGWLGHLMLYHTHTYLQFVCCVCNCNRRHGHRSGMDDHHMYI